MTKIYNVFLDNIMIGTTLFEKADAPMSVVFGQIKLINIESEYEYFKNYCHTNNIDLFYDNPEEKSITTSKIESLVVRNEQGVEIQCLGNQISGIDKEGFEITLEGVSRKYYEEEFPHHIKDYYNLLNTLEL